MTEEMPALFEAFTVIVEPTPGGMALQENTEDAMYSWLEQVVAPMMATVGESKLDP